MRTLIKYLLKTTSHFVFLLMLMVNACSQSDSRPEPSTASDEAGKSVAIPQIDIHSAIVTGNLDLVEQHIRAGSNINKKEAMSSSTPLMTAATFNKIDIAKALIDANADLNVKNNDGSTALHIAAFFGRIEIVQLLLDANADKMVRNGFGATPRETVTADFADLKPFYDMLIVQLEPMGFVLDMEELQKARVVIAMMLQ